MTSLRTKLTALLAVPLAVLAVLSILDVRSGNQARSRTERAVANLDLALAADNAALALVQERRLTAAAPDSDMLDEQRSQTDRALELLHARMGSSSGRPGIDDVDLKAATDATGDLADIRQRAASASTPDDALRLYAPAVTAVAALDPSLRGIGDRDLLDHYRAQRALVRYIERLSLEEGLLLQVFGSGSLDPSTYSRLSGAVAGGRVWLERFEETASPEQSTAYGGVSTSDAVAEAGRVRDRVLASGPSEDVHQDLEGDTTLWSTAIDRKIDLFMNLASKGAREVHNALVQERDAAGGLPLGSHLRLAAVAAGSAALLAALWRSVLRPVQQLATAATAAAAATAAGQDEEPARIATLDLDRPDELRQVAVAFNSVQETAVTLAAGPAGSVDAADEVVRNFGRRAQNLVTRQLAQIDDLEARTDDPDMLAELFALDHLSTRLRRTAECLVLLAGADSPRPWARPVSLVNVVRAAAAEAADYSRVDVAQMGAGAVTGAVANDVSHLLAELIDNALTYSPPESRVTIAGDRLPDGRYLTTVTDAGLGMPGNQLDAANRRLQGVTAPGDDAPLSRHFGLHVAGQLALRHGIEVKLVPSPYNGIRAEIVLPAALTVLPAERATAALSPGSPASTTVAPEDTVTDAASDEGPTQPSRLPAGRATPVPGSDRSTTVHPTRSDPFAMPAAGANDD